MRTPHATARGWVGGWLSAMFATAALFGTSISADGEFAPQDAAQEQANDAHSQQAVVAKLADELRQAELQRLGVDKLFGSMNLRGRGHSVAFSPDGKWIVAGGGIWDAETGGFVRTCPIEFDPFAIRFSPDGTKLAAASIFANIAVWDFTTDSAAFVIDDPLVHRPAYTSIAWSPDGKRLVTGDRDRTVRVWDAETGEEIHSYSVNSNRATTFSVAWSPDGKLYVGGDGTSIYPLAVFDTKTHIKVRDLDLQASSRIVATEFLSNDNLITCGRSSRRINGELQYDMWLQIWNVATGEKLRELPLANAQPYTMCITPDKTRAIVHSRDQKIRVYDMRSGEVLRELSGFRWQGMTPMLAASPDGKRFAYCGDEVVVRIYDMETGARSFVGGAGHDARLADFVVSQNGAYAASCADDGQVMIWDARASKLIWSYDCGPESLPHGLSWSPDGKVLYVAADEKKVGLWPRAEHNGLVIALDAENKRAVFRVETPMSPQACMASPDGKELAVVSAVWNVPLQQYYAVLERFDARSGLSLRRYRQLEAGDPYAWRVAYTANANEAIMQCRAADGGVARVDLESGDIELAKRRLFARGEFSADGSRYVYSNSGDAVVIDTLADEEMLRINLPNTFIADGAISDDGRWLAGFCVRRETVDGQTKLRYDLPFGIRLWDIETGRQFHVIDDITFSIYTSNLRFSHDKQTLYAGALEGVMAAWDISDAVAVQPPAVAQQAKATEEQAELDRLGVNKLFGSMNLRGMGHSVAFSPDGEWIVAGGSIWNAATGGFVRELPLGFDPVAMEFSPDGTRLAAVGWSDDVAVYDLAKKSMVFHKHDLEADGPEFTSVAWSPDGTKIIAGDRDSTIRIWDAESGEPIHTRSLKEGHDHYITDLIVAWSPDGKYFICGDGGNDYPVFIFDAATREKLRSLPLSWRNFGTYGLQLLNETEIVLLTGHDSGFAFLFWDIETGQQTREIKLVEDEFPRIMRVTPDGAKGIVHAADNKVRVYDLESGKVRWKLDGFRWQGMTPVLAVSPDGRRVAYCGDQVVVRVHDVETGARLFANGAGHDARLNDMAVSPDGARLASCGDDGRVMIWDTQTTKLLWTYNCGPVSLPHGLAWSPDSRVVYVAADERNSFNYPRHDHHGLLIALDARTREVKFRTETAMSPYTCVASADGQQLAVVSAVWNEEWRAFAAVLEIFDPRTGASRRQYDAYEVNYPQDWEAAFSSQSDEVVILNGANNQGFMRVNLASGESEHTDRQASALGVFSADGSRCAMTLEGDAVVLDTLSDEEICRIELDDAPVSRTTISSDGRWLATASKPAVTTHDDPAWQLQEPATLQIWDVATGNVLHTIDGVTFPISKLRFSHDKQTLYAGALEGVMAAWDISEASSVD